MPDVPTYQRQVSPAPLPGVRFDPNAPSSAFGVPQESPLGGMQQVAASIFEDEQRKANNTAVMGAAAKLAQRHTEILYGPAGHPELGALNQRGENAMAIPDQVHDAWQKAVSDISASELHNDTQRESFQRLVNDYGSSLYEATQRHVAQERQTIDVGNYKAFIAGEQQLAATNYQDPQRVEESIQKQSAAAADQAKKMGWTPDELKQEIMAHKSTTYVRTIELMANNHDVGTKAYFDAHRSDLVGADAVHAEQLTKETTVRQQGFAEADRIYKTAKDRQDAMTQASKIQDPDVREFAQRQLQEQYNVLKQNEAEQTNRNFIAASNILDQHPGADPRSVIPSSMWTQFTSEHKEALIRYAKGEQQNDTQAWLSFLDLRPQELGQLDQATYNTKFRTRFDQAHQNVADAQWAAARDALANGKWDDPKITEFYSDREKVIVALRTSGLIDPKTQLSKLPKDAALMVEQFYDNAARRIRDYEITTLGAKRKASPDEKQQIIDNMIQERVFIDRPWRSDIEKSTAILSQDEKNQAYVPTEKIPPSSYKAFENMLRARNMPIDQRTIERIYAAQLLDGRPLLTQVQDPNSQVNKIISGQPVPKVATPLVSPAKPIQPTVRRPGTPIGSALRTMSDYLVGGKVQEALGTKEQKKP